jgi:putative ABC transport system permease protein
MIWFLSLRSLKSRWVSTLLCVLSIALSVCLFLAIERLRVGAKEGFTNTLSQTDLIVGARSSDLQLMLYSVFHLGRPTQNIRFKTFKKIDAHSGVAWTIPLSLGDSFRGFRVVGTNENLFAHYRFRGEKQLKFAQGRPFQKLFDVVLGAQVANQLQHQLGDQVYITHGLYESDDQLHDQHPFQVSGILAPSGTPLDKSVFISLEGLEALHMPAEQVKGLTREEITVTQLTSFLLGAKNKFFILRLQQHIHNFSAEPLSAVIPALGLQDLWSTVAQVEKIFLFISFCVVLVGLLGIMIALFTSLNERRREIAILRSLGAGPGQLLATLVFESVLMVAAGAILGVLLVQVVLWSAAPALEAKFALQMPLIWFQTKELWGLLVLLTLGALAGCLPALRAYRNSLQDGLTPKT